MLNDKQKEAVISTEGYVRVVAGAGSGKTRTIASRYAYLVNDLGISTKSILCLTFTNKAAKEMKDRIETMIPEPVGDLVCTYHAFCLKFLKEEIYHLNLAKNFSIMDGIDQLDLLKEIYPELGLRPTERKYQAAMTEIRNTKLETPDYAYYFDDKAQRKPADWSSLFSAYITKQRKYNMLDFDDLIYITLYILNQFPDVHKKWSDRITYIMVDETQDNNKHNWWIVDKLSEINQNLFVVGDPDQAIYGWRGAKPEMFVDFDKTHTPCTDIILDLNYRSLQDILTTSNNVIRNNIKRIEKDLKAIRKGETSLIWHHAQCEVDEAEWIMNKIQKIQKDRDRYSDIAILYRNSHSSRSIEQALNKHKIPYVVYGGIRFFERKVIKDALAYLKLIEYGDNLSFLRVVNTPKRGLGDAFVAKLKKEAEEEGLSLFDTLCNKIHTDDFKRPGSISFCKLINEAREYKNEFPISEFVEYILNESGIRKTLKEDGDEEQMENLKELVSSIISYEESHSDESISLNTYLEDISLYTNMDYKKEYDTVKIMTIHQAKGLEFDTVFITNLSDGVLPSYRSLDCLEALEEERRIMYVAMTRAKNKLYLTDSNGYNVMSGDSKTPSRFISETVQYEIDEDSAPVQIREFPKKTFPVSETNTPLLKKGDTVFHPVFLYGTILEISNENHSYKIKFDTKGVKVINWNFKNLRLVEKI